MPSAWFPRLIAAATFCEYALRISCSAKVAPTDSAEKSRSGHASWKNPFRSKLLSVEGAWVRERCSGGGKSGLAV